MGWLCTVGVLGDAGACLALWVLNLIACVVLTGFNGALGIWPMVGMNIALASINIWFIRKLVSERHDEHAFEVLEVGPNDEYLRHVLRVHGDDIVKFQPNFVWDGATTGRSAYLVQRGDETVGVVLVRDAGGHGRAALRPARLPPGKRPLRARSLIDPETPGMNQYF